MYLYDILKLNGYKNYKVMTETSKITTKYFFENATKNGNISKDRQYTLKQIALKIASVYSQKNKVYLNFICTHNSRRSQLGQVWAAYAASYFNLTNIESFSGGTEVTAFHRNTVKTLQEAGFNFSLTDFNHQNPTYTISFTGSKKNIVGFSKRYDHHINKTPCIAITTCDSADTNCPFIPEALHRFHLPFIDPKMADDTDMQNETYLAINSQIAYEIFILFKEIKTLVS